MESARIILLASCYLAFAFFLWKAAALGIKLKSLGLPKRKRATAVYVLTFAFVLGHTAIRMHSTFHYALLGLIAFAYALTGYAYHSEKKALEAAEALARLNRGNDPA